MNEQSFVAKREPDWQRLTHLCARADASPTQLTESELKEMFRLYRRVSSDLAAVRTRSLNPQLATFLNDLVAKAYGTLYRPRKRNLFRAIADGAGLAARTVRKRKWAVVAAIAVTLFGALTAYISVDRVPEAKDLLLNPSYGDVFEKWKYGDMESMSFNQSSMMTGFYMSNNPFVAILTGSLAAASFGTYTTMILFNNGALLGLLTHELVPVDRVGYLYLHILPHGIPELTGIFVAGAAGFVIGWALIHPGRKKRSEALKEAGKDGLVLLATAVTLMFIAAPIEGFFSFNGSFPDWTRVLVIVIEAVAYGMFWTGFGKTPEELAASSPA